MDITQWNGCLSLWLGGEANIEQIDLVRDWSQSRVLRLKVRTGKGLRTIFAKQAPGGLDTEARIYRQLAGFEGFPAPSGTPVLIADQEWLLLAEAQGLRLAEATPDQYLSAAGYLADFHEQATQASWPAAIGLTAAPTEHIARLLVKLPEAMQKLAVSSQFTSVDTHLLSATREALQTHGPSLIHHLDSFPCTLCHGDCHSGNLFIGAAGIQLIDWGSASYAPGLLDLVGLIDVTTRMREHVGDAHEIVNAYWNGLSAQTRQAYGRLDWAWSLLRVTRALLELEWFVRDGDDYGTRANRELCIILDCLTQEVPVA